MSTERIIPISSIQPHMACEDCGHPFLVRGALAQTDTVMTNGATLYTFIEKCIMCDWQFLVSNVKIGA